MEQPTEPGFYWALVRRRALKAPIWEPVSLSAGYVQIAGDDRCVPAGLPGGWVLEWGPRIEPPDAPVTREELEAHIDAQSGISSVVRGAPR